MRRLLSITCCALLSLPGLAMESPLAVSPTSPEGVAFVVSACPTFSWTALDGAGGYKLVVYRVEGSAPVGEPVMEKSLPRGASSWTPSALTCLEPGGTYAWVVRAVDAQTTGDWSAASLFTVLQGPPAEELEATLEVVRRHLASGGELPESEDRQPEPNGALPIVQASEPPIDLAGEATVSPPFRVDGSGNVNASRLVVGSSASTSIRALFADSDWSSERVKITGRGGTSDVGTSLDLDSSTSSGGRSFSLISTAAGAAIGGGKLAVYDNTAGQYRMSIDGVNDVVKVRNLALTRTVRFDSAVGTSILSVSCEAGEVLTGGGCICSPTGGVRGSWPSTSAQDWECGCGDDSGVDAYAVCLKSTWP